MQNECREVPVNRSDSTWSRKRLLGNCLRRNMNSRQDSRGRRAKSWRAATGCFPARVEIRGLFLDQLAEGEDSMRGLDGGGDDEGAFVNPRLVIHVVFEASHLVEIDFEGADLGA